MADIILEGVNYPEWANEKTLDEIKAILEQSLGKGAHTEKLVKLLEDMQRGRAVDTQRARETTRAATTTAEGVKKQADGIAKEATVERNFRSKMLNSGRNVANAIKEQDIGGHLKDAGGLLTMTGATMDAVFSKLSGLMTAVGASIFNASKALVSGMGKFGEGVSKYILGPIGMFAGALTTVATGIVGYLLGAITSLGDSFYDLYDTGINMTNALNSNNSSLGGLIGAAADARLAVGDFTEFLAKNSVVALQIGAYEMGQFSKGVRDGLRDMGQFGLSIAETNEYIGDYLEQQRLTGVLDAMSAAQRTKAGINYITQLTELSAVTGKRRKQLAEEMKKINENYAYRAFMQGLDEQQQVRISAAMNKIGPLMENMNPQFLQDFQNSLVRANFETTETGKALVKFGATSELAMIKDLQERMKSGELTEAEASSRINKIIAELGKGTSHNIEQLKIQAAAGDASAQAFIDITTQADAMVEAQKKADQKNTDQQVKLLGNFSDFWQSIKSSFDTFLGDIFKDETFKNTMNEMSKVVSELFAPDKGDGVGGSLTKFAKMMATQVTGALKWFADPANMEKVKDFIKNIPTVIEGFIDGIKSVVKFFRSAFFKEVEVDTFDEAGNKTGTEMQWEAKSMGDIVGSIASGLKNLFLDNWKPIVGAIAGLFALKVLKDAMISGGTSLMSTVGGGLLSKMTGGGGGVTSAASAVTKGGPAGGAKPGKGGAGAKIGGFLGQVAGGLMRGIATGLAAFANPAIFVGAAILAGSIAVIGLGIGAAAAIIGLSLGPMVSSMEGFSKLDGDNLQKVGWGVGALGLGLMALAAGGVGNAISNLFNIFGESPIEKIKNFAAIGPELDAAGPKVKSFVDIINEMIQVIKPEALSGVADALKDFGVGLTAAGIGTFVSALGDPANLQKLAPAYKAFEDIDATKLAPVGPALTTFGTGLVSVAVGTFISGIGDPDNLKKLAPAYKAFEAIDATKLALVGPALKSFGQSLVDVAIGDFLSTLVNPEQLANLATGFIPFQNLNGENLKKVGEGMSAMGKGLQEWGKGGILESIGGVLSGLFGGESQLDQLKGLGEIATPLAGATTALKEFNPEMKKLFDLMTDPKFEQGADAFKTLGNNIQLLDNLSDLENEDRETLKIVGDVMGKMTGASMTEKSDNQLKVLQEISAAVNAQTVILQQTIAKGVKATKDAAEF